MKKVLIFLIMSVYIFGNFPTAFADSRSDNRQFKQKDRSGSGGHKQKFKQRRGRAPHAKKQPGVRKHRSAHRLNKKQNRYNRRTGPRVHKPHVKQWEHRAQRPYVVQKHRSRPRVQKPHVVQQHRPNRHVHRPRLSRNYRTNRHLYRPRYSRNYRSYPRVHYGHRHSYGHRIQTLPYGFISFSIGGLIYYYASGNYYRGYGGYYEVVTPPMGALITVPPPGYKVIYIDSNQYYFASGVYYIWDDIRRGYRVVPPPEVIHESREEFPKTLESSLDIFAYPNTGQSKNEQANDRYDCHLWAVGETDFDPSLEQSSSGLELSEYKRAITACLEARDYTVK